MDKNDRHINDKDYLFHQEETAFSSLDTLSHAEMKTLIDNLRKENNLLKDDNESLRTTLYQTRSENSEFFRDLIDSVDGLFLKLNKTLKIVFTNRLFEFITGLSLSDVSGLHLFKIFPSLDNNDINGMLEELKKSGKRSQIIQRIQINSKDYIFQINFYLTQEGIILFMRDVTLFTQTEKVYEAILNNSILGIVIYQDFKVAYINNRIEEMTGYTIDYLNTLTEEALLEIVHPHDVKRVYEDFRNFLETQDNLNTIEYRVFDNDGRLIWVECQTALIEYQGKPAVQVSVLDITQRKKALEELKNTEANLRAILNNNLQVFLLLDQQLRVIEYNKKATEEATSIFKSTLRKGAFVKDTLPSQEYEGFMNSCMLAFRGFFVSREWHSLTFHQPRYYELNYIPIVCDEDQPQRICFTAIDITERKLTERALRESEERFRATFEQAPVGIANIIEGGAFFKVNNMLCSILGYTNAELLNMTVYDVVHPDEKKDVADAIIKIFSNEFLEYRAERRFIRKDGSILWVNSFASAFNQFFDKPEYIIKVVEDISQRKEAEEALKMSEKRIRSIVEYSGDGISLVDENGIIKEWNDAMVKLSGFAKEEVIGQYMWDAQAMFDPDSFKTDKEKLQLKTMFTQMLNTGESPIIGNLFENTLTRRDGSEVVVQWRIFVIKTKRGYMIGNTTRDITENKKVMNELEKSQKELRALTSHLQSIREKERASIAREIHDELGQVLTSLKMNLKMIANDFEGKKISDELSYITNELNSMSALIDTSVGTIKRLITKLRPQVLDSLGLISALDWLIDDFDSKSNIQYSFESNVEEEKIEKDKSIAIFRIIQEAITNATRHANPNKISTALKYEYNTYKICVQDDGIGISDINMEKDFSFGLLGIRERAIFLGGDLTIETEPDQGTKICVTIPENQLIKQQ